MHGIFTTYISQILRYFSHIFVNKNSTQSTGKMIDLNLYVIMKTMISFRNHESMNRNTASRNNADEKTSPILEGKFEWPDSSICRLKNYSEVTKVCPSIEISWRYGLREIAAVI